MGIIVKPRTGSLANSQEQNLKDKVKEYWSERAEGYHKSAWRIIHSDKQRRTWQNILNEALGEEKLRILDVGTGPGIIAFLLADIGHNVTGVDLSEEMLKRARENTERLELPVEFRLGDAEALPFPDDTFDAVINRHLLWTLPDPERALCEWKRVLKPDGKLVIVDGNWYLNLDGSVKNKMWRFCAMLMVSITERRNAFRNYDPYLKRKLPLIYKKRPDYDVGLLRGIGFGDINILTIGRRSIGLFEYLKYGYYGDTFLISARAYRNIEGVDHCQVQ